MNNFWQWLSSNPIAVDILIFLLIGLVVTVAVVYLIAFFQGREVSFWPPKIGEKKGNTEQGQGTENQKLSEDHDVQKINDTYITTPLSNSSALNQINAPLDLASDLATTGLTGIQSVWHYAIDWPSVLRDTTSIKAILMYGHTWVTTCKPYLLDFFNRNRTRAILIFPDPEDKHLMRELGRRLGEPKKPLKPQDVVKKINISVDEIRNTFQDVPPNEQFLEIWFIPIAPVYSCYLMDNMAIAALYKHKLKKDDDIPSFLMKKDGTLYRFFEKDINDLLVGPIACGRRVLSIDRTRRE
jgi:hypothetical protein